MRIISAILFLAVTASAAGQGLVEDAPVAKVPTRTVLDGRALTQNFDIRASAGRSARKLLTFGESSVVLTNVRIDPDVSATGPKVKGACRVRVLVNDTPIMMTRRRIEGTRGQPRPIPRPEDDAAPSGLVATFQLPSAYPLLLEPVSDRVVIGAKDRLTIELSSPSKQTDCIVNAQVATTAAGRN